MPGAGEIGGGAVGHGTRTENTDAQSFPRILCLEPASAGARRLLDDGKLSSRSHA